jgi:UDP-glucose 4-epimerase
MHETAVDPLAAFREVNVQGTANLARQAASAGVRRLLFASSVKVNGEATGGTPFAENDTPHPQDAYGVSKWEAEQVLRAVGAETRLEVVILRPPLIYGPGVAGNFLRLLDAVASGMPLPLGAVQNRRSLLYVGNFVDALVACLDHPCAAGQTFLLSDGNSMSTPDLIKRIAIALGRRARLVAVPPQLMRMGAALVGRRDAADRLLGSLEVSDSAIRRELAWKPRYSVADGLAATAAWYRDLTAPHQQDNMRA